MIECPDCSKLEQHMENNEISEIVEEIAKLEKEITEETLRYSLKYYIRRHYMNKNKRDLQQLSGIFFLSRINQKLKIDFYKDSVNLLNELFPE